MKVSKRSEIPPFKVMAVVAAAQELERVGKNICHMEVGQPSLGAPVHVLEAANKAMMETTLGYTASLGIANVRERIARHYKEYYHVEVDPSLVVLTTGSSAAFLLTFLTSFDVGDKVVITPPSYPCYRAILQALDIDIVIMPVDESTNYQPTAHLIQDLLNKHKDIKGLILSSPSNPTGTMVSPEELQAIATLCHTNNVRLVSDEIYHRLSYGSVKESTAVSFSSSAIVINSFSKYYCMTGWRLGWIISPPDLLDPINRLCQNMYISAPTISQFAAMASFDCTVELDERKDTYSKNLKYLKEHLPLCGFSSFITSDGAFYLYCNIEHLSKDSEELCKEILNEANVAVTPGTDFDWERGNKYIRFSFAGSYETIVESIKRLKGWFTNRRKM